MKLITLLSKKRYALGFSLLCGIAYLIIITQFVFNFTNVGGGLLVWLFFPLIICAPALFIYKAINTYIELEARTQLYILFGGHIAVILLAVLMLLEMILIR